MSFSANLFHLNIQYNLTILEACSTQNDFYLMHQAGDILFFLEPTHITPATITTFISTSDDASSLQSSSTNSIIHFTSSDHELFISYASSSSSNSSN